MVASGDISDISEQPVSISKLLFGLIISAVILGLTLWICCDCTSEPAKPGPTNTFEQSTGDGASSTQATPQAEEDDPRYLPRLIVSVYRHVARQVRGQLDDAVFAIFWQSLSSGQPDMAKAGNDGIQALLTAIGARFNPKTGDSEIKVGACSQAQVAVLYGCPLPYLQRLVREKDGHQPTDLNSQYFLQLIQEHTTIRSLDPDVPGSLAVEAQIVCLGGEFLLL